jgi:cation diffusion facilitator family transporter
MLRQDTDPAVDARATDRHVQRVALYAVWVNVLLAGLRGWLAFLSGSLAVVAVTIDAGIDVAAALLLWVGLKLSVRKSRSFPYGLYKLENVIEVLIAVLIFVLAAEIIRLAMTSSNSAGTVTPLVIAVMAVTTLGVLGLSLYMRHEGREAASPGLLAEARHRWVDLAASVVVLISLVATYFGLPLDQVAAALVALFIVYSGWGLLWDGMKVLLDASLDRTTLDQVQKIVEADPAVTEVRSLTGRGSGRYRFLELVIAVRAENLEKAHAISTRIEKRVRAEVPRIDRVLIHFEPQSRTHLRAAIPLADRMGAISPHFGDAPFFARLSLSARTGELEEQQIVANPESGAQKAKGISVAEWLIRSKIDMVVLKAELGKGPEYAFRDAGVHVEVWQVDDVGAVIDRLSGALTPSTS